MFRVTEGAEEGERAAGGREGGKGEGGVKVQPKQVQGKGRKGPEGMRGLT